MEKEKLYLVSAKHEYTGELTYVNKEGHCEDTLGPGLEMTDWEADRAIERYKKMVAFPEDWSFYKDEIKEEAVAQKEKTMDDINKFDFWLIDKTFNEGEEAYHILEGDGEALTEEDEAEGLVDYIYYDVFENGVPDDREAPSDDGGICLLEKYYQDYSIEEIVQHTLNMRYTKPWTIEEVKKAIAERDLVLVDNREVEARQEVEEHYKNVALIIHRESGDPIELTQDEVEKVWAFREKQLKEVEEKGGGK